MIYVLNSDYFVRALTVADIDGPYPTWFQDQEVCRFNSHGKFFKSKAYFESYLRNVDGEDRIAWAICHVKDGHIGNVALSDIALINRTAEFAIIIGAHGHQGRGVGLLAGGKLIEHGFRKLNLERIYCGTAATNMGMKKLAERLGMTLEGTRREQLFLEGARVDVVEYGILRREFERSFMK